MSHLRNERLQDQSFASCSSQGRASIEEDPGTGVNETSLSYSAIERFCISGQRKLYASQQLYRQVCGSSLFGDRRMPNLVNQVTSHMGSECQSGREDRRLAKCETGLPATPSDIFHSISCCWLLQIWIGNLTCLLQHKQSAMQFGLFRCITFCFENVCSS